MFGQNTSYALLGLTYFYYITSMSGNNSKSKNNVLDILIVRPYTLADFLWALELLGFLNNLKHQQDEELLIDDISLFFHKAPKPGWGCVCEVNNLFSLC